MKPLASIGNWRIYQMNGAFVALNNRGKEFSSRFSSLEEAVRTLSAAA